MDVLTGIFVVIGAGTAAVQLMKIIDALDKPRPRK